MEEYLPKVFIVLLCVLLMFIFPIVTSYERQDDISYAYASKAVHTFVDNVRNKGYISPKMYTDFVSLLNTTGNTYDITMTRERKTYYPIIEIYDYDTITGGYSYVTEISPSTYGIDTVSGINEVEIVYNGVTYRKYKFIGTKPVGVNIEDYISEMGKQDLIDANLATEDNFKEVLIVNARVQSESIGKEQLIHILFPNNLAVLNTPDLIKAAVGDASRYAKFGKDDIFSVSVKNSNTTVSTLLDFMFLPESVKSNISRIYVNYGGAIRNENWSKTCPNCGAINTIDAISCINCAYKWSKLCLNCGTLNKVTAVSCVNCGSTNLS